MVFRYNPPEDTIMGIKPGLITLYFPSLKKARRIHLSSGADVGHWMSFGLGPIKDITALKDAAVVTVTDTNGATVITFAPKDEKEVVRKVVISLKEDYTPLGVTISEKNGDLTIMEFSDQKVNSPVDDALFDVKIPPGVVIEEIGN
jgi:outer membrane lipoprotein-sorting protein